MYLIYKAMIMSFNEENKQKRNKPCKNILLYINILYINVPYCKNKVKTAVLIAGNVK